VIPYDYLFGTICTAFQHTHIVGSLIYMRPFPPYTQPLSGICRSEAASPLLFLLEPTAEADRRRVRGVAQPSTSANRERPIYECSSGYGEVIAANRNSSPMYVAPKLVLWVRGWVTLRGLFSGSYIAEHSLLVTGSTICPLPRPDPPKCPALCIYSLTHSKAR